MFHKLTIDSIAARAVLAPMSRPLRTAAGDVPAAPLVLVDVHTNEGIVGRSYAFAYTTAEGIDGNYISDASVAATAEALVCHPNTVLYRLRRIEKRTGRSRSRPRDVAELCLVFEVQRRLM